MNKFVTGFALSLTLALPAAAQEASTVIAKVGDVEITLGHMIAMESRLPAQFQQLPDAVLYEGMLEQLIQQEVLAAAARQSLTNAQSLGLENEARAFLASSVLQSASEGEVTAEELQEAYSAAYGSSEPQPEFNASHILVETEEEAKALIVQLEEGSDFAGLAQTHSTGPSGPNGGALGWFGPGMMVPPFEAAVVALEAGEVSGPVQTQFGWHVVKLNEKRERGAPEISEVQVELEQKIRAARVEALIQDLTGDAIIERVEVEADPAVIRNKALLQD